MGDYRRLRRVTITVPNNTTPATSNAATGALPAREVRVTAVGPVGCQASLVQ